MSARKRQTFDKMNRERAVRERRAQKQEKRAQRKLAAQAPHEDGAPTEESEQDSPQPTP